jgi:hypothetical protein
MNSRFSRLKTEFKPKTDETFIFIQTIFIQLIFITKTFFHKKQKRQISLFL